MNITLMRIGIGIFFGLDSLRRALRYAPVRGAAPWGSDRRAPIVFLFVLLLCVSIAEHRIAEVDAEWDPDVVVENDDGFDSDEICGKLTLVDDVPRPMTPLIHEAIDHDVPSLTVAPRKRLVVDRSDPRAPPRPSVASGV